MPAATASNIAKKTTTKTTKISTPSTESLTSKKKPSFAKPQVLRTNLTNVTFKVGDSAVYPAYGLTIIKGIEERDMGAGKKKAFYILQVVENQMTIMVPMDNASSVGLCAIIGDKEVNEVYTILKDRNVKIDQTTWNRRYREYSEKIKTGSVFEIAEVLRNLFLLRHSKDLSFGERKMLDQAKSLLVRELSLAQASKENEIEQEIQTIFSS